MSLTHVYTFQTPLAGIFRLLGGSSAGQLTMSDKTVMALNPTDSYERGHDRGTARPGRGRASTPGAAGSGARGRPRASRAQVLVIFAMSALVFVGMCAVVVDVAWYWANTLRVQRAADAAALAGRRPPPG